MNPLEPLVNQLKKCPGLGEKSAQRIAFFLISISQGNVDAMAKTMVETRANIRYCDTCFNISFEARCHVCKNPKRDAQTLCIVAEPKDIFAIERTGSYQGIYHVLGGLLSPLDGIQPESLRIKELIQRIGNDTFKEIVFAINPTVEGDSTVMYISSLLEPFHVNCTRLAYGLPMGSDIDYADEVTLSKAISARRELV
ncbi:recombination mediator RecR [bacterium]|nr:recombination mediator RecR [bacterium]